MRISRLFINAPLKTGSTVSLLAEQLNYISRVLRLKPGDELTLFNGLGGEYSATIMELNKKEGLVMIGGFRSTELESPLDITLAQGISRGERMDYTLQKAVELGVTRFVPVFTERCVVNLTGDRLASRQHHWQGIISSACEQCGRNTLPELIQAMSLRDWLASDKADHRLMLHAAAGNSLRSLNLDQGRVSLLIGPEGGLAENERDDALAKGYQRIQLGPRILRTETAGIAALACLQALYGDAG
jgi:16S rRNA (uracil1498-N3)-methyltransferase